MDEQSEIWNLLSEIEDPSLDHVHSSIDRGVARHPTHACLDAMKESKEEILRKHPNTCDTNENIELNQISDSPPVWSSCELKVWASAAPLGGSASSCKKTLWNLESVETFRQFGLALG